MGDEVNRYFDQISIETLACAGFLLFVNVPVNSYLTPFLQKGMARSMLKIDNILKIFLKFQILKVLKYTKTLN